MEPNMESGSDRRAVWIYVAVALLLMCCCCAMVTAAAAGSWFASWPFSWSFDRPFERSFSTDQGQEGMDRIFRVDAAPRLAIDNFAGSITVRNGEEGEMRVIAVKKAPSAGSLDRITIEVDEREGGLVIETRKSQVLGSGSVQFEIIAPTNTDLDLHTGAGNVDVRGFRSNLMLDSGAGSLSIQDAAGIIDAQSGAGSISMRGVSGEVDAHSGAGSIDISDAEGQMRLDTGTGSISYRGALRDDCRFESGAGSIELRLPADLDMEVDLGTGIGSIDVGYAVDGIVDQREVRGVIGSGRDGSIYAQTGSGGIDLFPD
jgi:DUF4097 and DUF4098 domain-containing protein YvlB